MPGAFICSRAGGMLAAGTSRHAHCSRQRWLVACQMRLRPSQSACVCVALLRAHIQGNCFGEIGSGFFGVCPLFVSSLCVAVPGVIVLLTEEPEASCARFLPSPCQDTDPILFEAGAHAFLLDKGQVHLRCAPGSTSCSLKSLSAHFFRSVYDILLHWTVARVPL